MQRRTSGALREHRGPAIVGTEFQSTGRRCDGTFRDSSVATEALSASVFEFVTEARLSTKKAKVVEWSNVHRYELSPQGEGCRSLHAPDRSDQRAAGALGMFQVPGLRSLASRCPARSRGGDCVIWSKLAEESAGEEPVRASVTTKKRSDRCTHGSIAFEQNGSDVDEGKGDGEMSKDSTAEPIEGPGFEDRPTERRTRTRSVRAVLPSTPT